MSVDLFFNCYYIKKLGQDDIYLDVKLYYMLVRKVSFLIILNIRGF